MRERIYALLQEELKGKAALSGLGSMRLETPLAALKLDSMDFVRLLMKVRGGPNPEASPEPLVSLSREANMGDLVAALSAKPEE